MDWPVFAVFAVAFNACVLFIDWFLPENRDHIWRVLGRAWLWVDSLDYRSIPRQVAQPMSRQLRRIFGARYISRRAATASVVCSLCLLLVLAATLGLLQFRGVAHDYLLKSGFDLTALSAAERVTLAFGELTDLVTTEPLWFVTVLLVVSLVSDFVSIGITRRVVDGVANSNRLRGAGGWLALDVAVVALLVTALMLVMQLRPYVIVIGYHFYREASRQFWVWTIVPSVAVPTTLLAGIVVATAALKVVARPGRWFFERLLRRVLESEKGALSILSAALTAVLAMGNAVLNAGWFGN